MRISKAFGSYALMIYIFLLTGFSFHQTETCEHHLTDQTEHHEDDSEETCCPPFAPCKFCSHFTIEPILNIEIITDIELHQYQNIVFTGSVTQVIMFPFWHPPQKA